jgi:hypothetical protein
VAELCREPERPKTGVLKSYGGLLEDGARRYGFTYFPEKGIQHASQRAEPGKRRGTRYSLATAGVDRNAEVSLMV